jgi:uncharacterized protein (TIGR03790 family)
MAQADPESGDGVAVVYNTDMPGSKDVADHYAAMRHVPENQVVGWKMPTRDVITRKQYQDEVETPLLRFLDDQKLLVFGPDLRSTNPAAIQLRESKIRYLVLCYGVPVRVGDEPNLHEPGEEKFPEPLRKNGAAVDSELCLLPLTNLNHMLAGYIGNRFYGTTNAAWFQPANGLLMVARLDGPTAAIARGLVDKAMQAESDGLWGRAYFDLRILPEDTTSKRGDDWMRAAAATAHKYGFDTVLDDKPPTFSAGFPMSQIALYAGWYDPEVSGPFKQPNVEFMPGAFAYHLHSFSAQRVRSATNNWVGPLLADGAAATMGCVDEPYLDGTPNMAIFFSRFLAGFSFGEAAYASQATLSWQTTVIGDPLYRPFGKDPRKLHESLNLHHSPMIEWSHERIINLSLNHGVAPSKLIDYLKEIDTTAQSAVLTEKLGELYKMEGQTNLALQSWQRALTIHPTPLQAVRLMFDIADEQAASGKEDLALDTYDNFLKQNPNYPDALALYQKMEALAKKLHKRSQAKRYEKEIARLTPPAK